ncbi:MAG: 4-alpha-glucanotransferase [Bacteroidales bacterium]
MRLHFHINYKTQYGEELYLALLHIGSDSFDIINEYPMCYGYDGDWNLSIHNLPNSPAVHYIYLVKIEDREVRRTQHRYVINTVDNYEEYDIYDRWQDIPTNAPLYTSAFTESFLSRVDSPRIRLESAGEIILKVDAPTISPNHNLILIGEGDYFGNWQTKQDLCFDDSNYPSFTLRLDFRKCKQGAEYKLAFIDSERNEIFHWEEGDNRVFFFRAPLDNAISVINLEEYRDTKPSYKYSGTAIPLFSLRSKSSFGIGDFGDLYKFVDWSAQTGQRVIQLLPINDTTMTHTWVDSYPYNANSIYALHPAYIDLTQLPQLNDRYLSVELFNRGSELNQLSQVDYEGATELKWDYLRKLFNQEGKSILESDNFKEFFDTNREWLVPYAVFSSLRERYKTPDFRQWEEDSVYQQSRIDLLSSPSHENFQEVALHFYIQYNLHLQLLRVRHYAHTKGVILKGDIPIGISPNSVEAWCEPHLFNMNTQAGAPPDAFSVDGQNWGFPTYNWDEMSKDNLLWWRRRFQKMSDYFDAYRIDHLLGFFRIWEIPKHSVQGLLGYFNPALPFTRKELEDSNFWFDENRYLRPYIDEWYIDNLFGQFSDEVKSLYLSRTYDNHFTLKESNDTQRKIQAIFEQKGASSKYDAIRSGLMSLCNDVLFVRDPKDVDKYHPRISAHSTRAYQLLDSWQKEVFNNLYTHFFYERHNEFWKDQAMKKLPILISATNMLVCVEDLGMIPDSVPRVISDLQVLSLEIQSMPKDSTMDFGLTNHYPYLSVCTTSTHDMSTIREWWEEDYSKTERYFRDILWRNNKAPVYCEPWIAKQIVKNHLASPSMLVILPLQDWLAIDGKIRRDDPKEERINVPSNPKHYWRYRMHITIEELISDNSFNNTIKQLIIQSGR